MFFSLWLSVCLGAEPPTWTFRDEANVGTRSVLVFRTREFGDRPIQPLHAEDKPKQGSRFSVIELGPKNKSRFAIVWHHASQSLWLDADSDGRFSEKERHQLGNKPLEIAVNVTFSDKPEPQTMLLRQRGDSLAYAVRGYRMGSISLADKTHSAILTDGDADGCFDKPNADRIWIDLDQNGQYDPLTESFLFGTAIQANGSTYLIAPKADGSNVQVRERPSEIGQLRSSLHLLPKTKLLDVNAQLVSEWGELVSVTKLNQPLSIPAGKYRIDSMSLKIEDTDGQVWNYSFTGDRRMAVTIQKGKEQSLDLLQGLRVSFELIYPEKWEPGSNVKIDPSIHSDTGLYLIDCRIGGNANDYGHRALAKTQLKGPGSTILDEVECTFL